MLSLSWRRWRKVPRGRKPKAKEARPVGRPTEYRPEMCDDVRKWVEEGIVNHEIAARLGIAESTLYEWKQKYPEFAEAFEKGHQYRHQNVINALYKRCIGYTYEEITKEPVEIPSDDPDKPPKKRMVVTKKVRKQMAPDTNAIEFYLTNKLPDQFKHKTEVQSNVTADVHVKRDVDLSNLTDEELDQLEKLLEKASQTSES